MGKLKGPKVVRMPSRPEVMRNLSAQFKANNWHMGSVNTLFNLACIVQRGNARG